jgi:hypothetical protein
MLIDSDITSGFAKLSVSATAISLINLRSVGDDKNIKLCRTYDRVIIYFW